MRYFSEGSGTLVQALEIAVFALLVTAAASDLHSRRIPNVLVLAIAAAGLARLAIGLATGLGIGAALSDIGIAAALFVAGALLFHFGRFGGGDVKLIAASALWLGAGNVAPFLLATALAGGLLALVYMATRLRAVAGAVAPAPINLPYGVAIAAGAILAAT